MSNMLVCGRALTIGVALWVCLASCAADTSGTPAASSTASSPTASAEEVRSGRSTVHAFFAAARAGNRGQAQMYVADGAVTAEDLDELTRLRDAVSARVSGDGPDVQVVLTSTTPMQYWPLCPFTVSLSSDRQRISGLSGCALPAPGSSP
ncbi:MAG: hypothetical protein ABR549_05760 [Mycobacteriales bacterium]